MNLKATAWIRRGGLLQALLCAAAMPAISCAATAAFTNFYYTAIPFEQIKPDYLRFRP
jgi:hypothetical protein